MSANLGMNCQLKLARSKKDRTSFTVVGVGQSSSVWAFSSAGETPPLVYSTQDG